MKKYLKILLVAAILILLGFILFIVFYKFWKKEDNKIEEKNKRIEYYQDEALKPFAEENRKELEKENARNEKEEEILQYAKEGKVKEWEKLIGRKFSIYDYIDFSVNVKGYVVKEQTESFGGEKIILTNFVIVDSSNEDFKYVLSNNENENYKNKVILGCYENSKIKPDGKGDAGDDYISNDISKMILNSSEKNQVEVNLIFKERGGFGCLCCNAPYQIRKKVE